MKDFFAMITVIKGKSETQKNMRYKNFRQSVITYRSNP